MTTMTYDNTSMTYVMAWFFVICLPFPKKANAEQCCRDPKPAEASVGKGTVDYLARAPNQPSRVVRADVTVSLQV